MKIAFISTMAGFPWGGSEELWAATAKLALKNKHRVSVSVLKWESTPKKIQELKELGATVEFRNRNSSKNVLSSAKKKIKKLVNFTNPYYSIFAQKPDIICISMGTTTEILTEDNLSPLLDKTTIPFCLLSQFNLEAGRLDYQISRKNIFNKAKKVFFVSERNRQTAEAQLLLKLKNSLVVSNPVNISSKQIIKLPEGDTIHFASVARLDCNVKGQDIIVKILSSDKWKNRKWVLNFYGNGPDEKYLKDLASFYGLNGRIVLHGNVEDINRLWSENHLLLLPSLAEGTPLALIESMLCGRTAVVSDVGGNSDYILEGITGFLAEAPTIKSFGAAMERAWSAKTSWKEIGEKAYEYASGKTDPNPGKTLLDYLTEK